MAHAGIEKFVQLEKAAAGSKTSTTLKGIIEKIIALKSRPGASQ